MRIIEKDFKIECEASRFTLSLLKSKKELKEDSEDAYKLGGYFSKLENAIGNAISFRGNKKYPFKFTSENLKKQKQFQKTTDLNLHNVFLLLDKPITDFFNTIK